jgi:hypothetical protein
MRKCYVNKLCLSATISKHCAYLTCRKEFQPGEESKWNGILQYLVGGTNCIDNDGRNNGDEMLSYLEVVRLAPSQGFVVSVANLHLIFHPKPVENCQDLHLITIE